MTQISNIRKPVDSQLVWKIADLHDLRCRLALAEGFLLGLEFSYKSMDETTLSKSGSPFISLKSRTLRWSDFKNSIELQTGRDGLREEASLFLSWAQSPIETMDRYFEYGFGLFWILLLSNDNLVQKSLINLWNQFVFENSFLLYLTDFSDELILRHTIVLNEKTDLTSWMTFVLNYVDNALLEYLEHLKKLFLSEQKFRHFDKYDLNRRQRSILAFIINQKATAGVADEASVSNRELVQALGGSRESIKRDLLQLVQFGLIKKLSSGGRSTAYVINSES